MYAPRRWNRTIPMMALLALVTWDSALAQPEVSVNIGVEKQTVVVGEPFLFRIVINGSNDAAPPDLAALTQDFDVEVAGTYPSNSQSITIINGQRSEVVKRTLNVDYQLRARRTGVLTIPQAAVIVNGRTYTTNPVRIQVNEATESEDFDLESTLSKNDCYVGEAIVLTTVFYIETQVKDVRFSMPALALDSLRSEALPVSNVRGDNIELNIDDKRVVATQEKITRNGEAVITLTFRHILIPRQAGTLILPKTILTAQGATGRRVQTRSLFGGSRTEYDSVVLTTDALSLNVKPLPTQGKPTDFSGLVGNYTIAATASPTTVDQGEPITLNLTLSGSHSLRFFELPPLQQQTVLATNFTIPEDMAPGALEGDSKRFTQTIRANSPKVTEIPPVSITYLNADTGHYQTASTNPIPITVNETNVVTSIDAEGGSVVAPSLEHIAIDEGIAHNFTDASALIPQRFGPDVWLRTASSWLLLLMPPLLYTFFALGLFVRQRGGIFSIDSPQSRAFPELMATLDALDKDHDVHSPVLDALRSYLGTRLNRQASALTFADAAPPLEERGVDPTTRETLKEIFDECEVHRYAGGAGVPTENAAFVDRVRECVQSLNKELG